MTRCEPCEGNNHSSFGVCLPCPLEKVVSEDKSRCENCIERQTAVATAAQEARTCGCDDIHYNATAQLLACFDDHYSGLQLQAAKESSPVSDAPDSTMPEQQEQTAAQKRDEAKRRRALLERYQNTCVGACPSLELELS